MDESVVRHSPLKRQMFKESKGIKQTNISWSINRMTLIDDANTIVHSKYGTHV